MNRAFWMGTIGNGRMIPPVNDDGEVALSRQISWETFVHIGEVGCDMNRKTVTFLFHTFRSCN